MPSDPPFTSGPAPAPAIAPAPGPAQGDDGARADGMADAVGRALLGAQAGGVAGRLTRDAPLAGLVWFKSGGSADWLFEPESIDDLRALLARLEPGTPVMSLGLGSNLIVRDGGVPGLVVRLGKPFARVSAAADGQVLECGGGAPGVLVASCARDAGIAGLEFLRGIPGTVGGMVRMNAGAYGRDMSDILIDADVVLPDGALARLACADLAYAYRHSSLPPGAIVVAARMRGKPGQSADIQAEMDRIASAREQSQPVRSKTGGSTFRNPPGDKAWRLVDAAGCRGLAIGGAQVSEKHANFLINTGDATSAQIEELGEEVRRRVAQMSGVMLEWEIERVGRP